MKILTDNYNNMIANVGKITKGMFPEIDPSVELWKIDSNEGTFYAVASGFVSHQVPDEDVPEDYHNYSYTPEEGFVYHKPSKTQEQIQEDMQQQITDLQLAITELYEMIE